ncbi:MAG: restriction endonuclease subunit S [Rhodanobacter sp.]
MSQAAEQALQVQTSWQIVPLSEVCEFKPSKDIPRSMLASDAAVSFVPMSDLGELVKYFDAKEFRSFADVVKGYTYFADGDVLCAKITPCFENGKLGIAGDLENGVGFGSSEFVVMRPKHQLLAEYLYYYLSRDEFREAGARVMSGAVGHKRVPKEYFEDQPIPLPPLEEQKRIVAVLDQAFAAIDRARAHAEANLADGQQLVAAAMEQLFPNDREMTVGRSLGDLCEAIIDCEHKTAPTQDLGIPSIRTPNIGKGRLRLDGVNRVSEETYREWTRRAEPQPGDLILAREAPAGNVAVIPEGMRVCLGQRTVLLRPKKDLFIPTYLAHLLLMPSSQTRLLAHSRGATVQHINVKDIRAFKVSTLPSLAKQSAVVQRIERLMAQGKSLADAYARKLADLANLRQSLLQKAFSGQLT